MFPISKVLKNQLKLLKTSLPILDSRIQDRELWIEGTVYIILGILHIQKQKFIIEVLSISKQFKGPRNGKLNQTLLGITSHTFLGNICWGVKQLYLIELRLQGQGRESQITNETNSFDVNPIHTTFTGTAIYRNLSRCLLLLQTYPLNITKFALSVCGVGLNIFVT